MCTIYDESSRTIRRYYGMVNHVRWAERKYIYHSPVQNIRQNNLPNSATKINRRAPISPLRFLVYVRFTFFFLSFPSFFFFFLFFYFIFTWTSSVKRVPPVIFADPRAHVMMSLEARFYRHSPNDDILTVVFALRPT